MRGWAVHLEAVVQQRHFCDQLYLLHVGRDGRGWGVDLKVFAASAYPHAHAHLPTHLPTHTQARARQPVHPHVRVHLPPTRPPSHAPTRPHTLATRPHTLAHEGMHGRGYSAVQCTAEVQQRLTSSVRSLVSRPCCWSRFFCFSNRTAARVFRRSSLREVCVFARCSFSSSSALNLI